MTDKNLNEFTTSWLELLKENSFIYKQGETDDDNISELLLCVCQPENNLSIRKSVTFQLKKEFDSETIVVGNIRGEEEKEIAIDVLTKRFEFLAKNCSDTERLEVDLSKVESKEMIEALSIKMKELIEEKGLNIVVIKADKKIKKLEQTEIVKAAKLNCE